jgi:hypothetical protein
MLCVNVDCFMEPRGKRQGCSKQIIMAYLITSNVAYATIDN